MKALQKVAGSLLVAVLTMAGVVSFGGTAYADDRQPLGQPIAVSVGGTGPDIPVARVSRSVGSPGAWAFITPEKLTGTQSGYGLLLDVYRVLPHDGQGLSDECQRAICDGAVADITNGLPSFVAPTIDLSTIPWLSSGLVNGTYVFSDVWTGDLAWNPNVHGMLWTPSAHGEVVSLVDTRLQGIYVGTEWNMTIQFVDHVAYTPTWDCTTLPPFTPETGDKDPVAVPDVGVVPAGTPSVRVSVLDNDELPNGVKHLEVAEVPAHGIATVDFTAADWPIDYVPEAGFVGEDTFTYRVTDNLDKVSETTVVIDVLPAPAGPPIVTDPPLVADPPAGTPQVSDPAPEPFHAATGIEPTTSAVSVALFAWWGIVSAFALGTVFLLRRWILS